MKLSKLFIILAVLASCKPGKKHVQPNINEQIYKTSHSILNDHDERIWNLSSIDTSDIEIYKGCFLEANDSALFISIGGEAGGSAGDANRLNLIAHIKDSVIVDYYQQGPLPDTILDVNHDGVKDFYFHVSTFWMGTCGNIYSIKSFAHNKESMFFQQVDESILDCGGIVEETSSLGDTLSTVRNLDFRDFDNDKAYVIILSTEYKVHNGGSTEAGIIDSLLAVSNVDTLKLVNGSYQ